MANIITAGNSTNGGTAITTDTSGTLNIVTGSGSGANAITIDASQNVAMTASQTVAGNLNVTGSITGGSISVANSLRAWVNFNGTGTVAIRASGNVSSITDNGTGDYTVNFTTAMPDADYSFNITPQSITSAGQPIISNQNAATAPTTSAIRIINGSAWIPGVYASTPQDPVRVSVAIFR